MQRCDQQEVLIQTLANTISNRCVQECDQCVGLRQKCEFFAHCRYVCTSCTVADRPCTGYMDGGDITLIFTATMSLKQKMDRIWSLDPHLSMDRQTRLVSPEMMAARGLSNSVGSSAPSTRADQDPRSTHQLHERIKAIDPQQHMPYLEMRALQSVLETCYLDLMALWSDFEWKAPGSIDSLTVDGDCWN